MLAFVGQDIGSKNWDVMLQLQKHWSGHTCKMMYLSDYYTTWKDVVTL